MSIYSQFRFRVACLLPHCLRQMVLNFLAARRRRKASTLKARVEDLRNLIIHANPITKLPPAEGKLRLLHEGNTVLLALFARKCRELGLRYWLDYGTLLGAVRHKGFIPGDDDLDVSMMRDDFDKLLAALPTIFPEEEGFTWRMHAFLQIGYKNSPLSIDIYPFHFYKEPFNQENRIEVDRALTQYKKSVVFQPPLINMTDEQIRARIARDILKGAPPADEREHPGIFLTPAIMFTKNTYLAYEDIFPLATETFEGIEFTVPNHARQYLRFFYGDYMAYPSSISYKHPLIERMVRETAFEAAVDRFIDIYGKQI